MTKSFREVDNGHGSRGGHGGHDRTRRDGTGGDGTGRDGTGRVSLCLIESLLGLLRASH